MLIYLTTIYQTVARICNWLHVIIVEVSVITHAGPEGVGARWCCTVARTFPQCLVGTHGVRRTRYTGLFVSYCARIVVPVHVLAIIGDAAVAPGARQAHAGLDSNRPRRTAGVAGTQRPSQVSTAILSARTGLTYSTGTVTIVTSIAQTVFLANTARRRVRV